MSQIYSNLPQKSKTSLEKTQESLQTNQYVEKFELNQNDLDAAIGFFVKRGFNRQSAEDTAYIILQQAKIDNVSSQSIIDQLKKTSEVQLSELITVVLNANRYKSSRLGVRNTRSSDDFGSRNIIA